MPELRKSVEPVNTVLAPPTELVKVPRTASDLPDAKVKLDALLRVVLLVEVAFPFIVHPKASGIFCKVQADFLPPVGEFQPIK